MKNIEEFVKSLVNIEKLETCNGDYGHHPMQMSVEDKLGTMSLVALCGQSVGSVYGIAKEFNKKGINKLYLSLDFPVVGDFKHDTVVVISIEDDVISCFGIPYDTKSGEQFDRITVEDSEALKQIMKEFTSSI